MRRLIAVLALAACGTGGEEGVSRRACERYRDHLVELRYQGAGSDSDITAHKRAMKQALGEKFVSSCESKLSMSELQCGLHANDLKSATACAKRGAN